jgi:hypothetical protein
VIGQPNVDRDILPVRKLCPCGCGRYLPEPVRTIHMGPAGMAIEEWLMEQGLTLESLRAPDRHKDMVEARRRVIVFLHEHGWGFERIGNYIGRDRGTVRSLLGLRKK